MKLRDDLLLKKIRGALGRHHRTRLDIAFGKGLTFLGHRAYRIRVVGILESEVGHAFEHDRAICALRVNGDRFQVREATPHSAHHADAALKLPRGWDHHVHRRGHLVAFVFDLHSLHTEVVVRSRLRGSARRGLSLTATPSLVLTWSRALALALPRSLSLS